MRHRKAHRKLGRTTNQRKALLSGLAINLIEKEKITTTLPKAKEIRPFVEKLITKGKRYSALAYPKVYRILQNKEATKKVISHLALRFAHRCGGYIRIVKAGYRYGDQAPLAVIEFVQEAS